MRPQPRTRAFRRQSVLSLPEMSRPSAPSAVIAALPTAKSCRSMMSSTCAPASIAHAAAASLSFPAQSICPGQSAPHTSVIRWVSAANGAYRKPPFSAGHGRITQSAPYVQPWMHPAFGTSGGSSAFSSAKLYTLCPSPASIEQSSAERRSPPITANFTNKPPPRSMVFGWT